jgi:hypothetical protein
VIRAAFITSKNKGNPRLVSQRRARIGRIDSASARKNEQQRQQQEKLKQDDAASQTPATKLDLRMGVAPATTPVLNERELRKQELADRLRRSEAARLAAGEALARQRLNGVELTYETAFAGLCVRLCVFCAF